MEWSNRKKLIFGGLTLVPTLTWFVLMSSLIPRVLSGNHSSVQLPPAIGFATFIIWMLAFFLIVYYLIYLAKSKNVTSGKKVIWTVVILMLNVLGMPFFWYFCVWKYKDTSEPRRQSGLGIASFVLAIVAGVLEIGGIVYIAIMQAKTQGVLDDNSPVIVTVGLMILIGMLSNLIGIGLATGGLFQKERKRVMVVVGLCINVALLLVMAGIIAFGSVID